MSALKQSVVQQGRMEPEVLAIRKDLPYQIPTLYQQKSGLQIMNTMYFRILILTLLTKRHTYISSTKKIQFLSILEII